MNIFEQGLNDLTRQAIEAGIPEAQAHASRAGLRRQMIQFIDEAASDPDAGLPLLIDHGEIVRLYDVAYAAAVQTGAKGHELDQVTAAVFRALAAWSSREAAAHMNRREALRVVT